MFSMYLLFYSKNFQCFRKWKYMFSSHTHLFQWKNKIVHPTLPQAFSSLELAHFVLKSALFSKLSSSLKPIILEMLKILWLFETSGEIQVFLFLVSCLEKLSLFWG